MKDILFLAILTLIGCQQLNKKNTLENEYKDVNSTFIDQLIPQTLSFTPGAFLNSKMEEELKLFEYFNSNYINFLDDFHRINEILFKSELFNDGSSEVYIKESKTYDNEQIEFVEKYLYVNGKIKSIAYETDPKYSTYFFYENNKLVKIVKETATVPFTETLGNKVTHYPSTGYTYERSYNYADNKMISIIESRSDRFGIDRKEFFQSVNEITNKSYLRIVPSTTGTVNLYGFSNGSLQFFASYGNEQDKYPFKILVYSGEGTSITVKQYDLDDKSSEIRYQLLQVFNIQRSYDYKFESILHKEIWPQNRNSLKYTTLHYFEYHYSGNEFLACKISQKKYDNKGVKAEDVPFSIKTTYLRVK